MNGKMWRPYLFLATAFAIFASSESLDDDTNHDIIWYPVEGENDVFVSIYGEKHRSTLRPENYRTARFTGDEHFSRSKRMKRQIFLQGFPTQPPFGFQNPNFPFNPFFPFNNNPNNNNNNNNNNIWGTSQRPTESVWSNANLQNGFNQPSKWPSSPQNIWRPEPWNKPTQPPVWSNSPNRPNQWNPFNPGRPVFQDDADVPGPEDKPNKEKETLIFPENSQPTKTTTELPDIPNEPTTMSPCERMCLVTPEFNPVCGTDFNTYSNMGRLKCARACGKDVGLSHFGSCGARRSLPTIKERFWFTSNDFD